MPTTFPSMIAVPQLRMDLGWPSATTARVAVTGEIDLATAPGLRQRLLGVVSDQRLAVLEVDLAGVTFLACAGINALLDVHDAATLAGRHMQVTHPPSDVHRVLRLTGLLYLLRPRPTDPGRNPRSFPGGLTCDVAEPEVRPPARHTLGVRACDDGSVLSNSRRSRTAV